MAISGILPVISLLQHMGDDDWCFRVAGTEVERRWARKLTGANYFDIDFVSPRAIASLRQEFRQVVEWPCASWSRRRVELASGRPATIETVRLPLRAADGSVSLMVSASEEFCQGTPAPSDAPREIIKITEQEFVDIGAGRPAESALREPSLAA